MKTKEKKLEKGLENLIQQLSKEEVLKKLGSCKNIKEGLKVITEIEEKYQKELQEVKELYGCLDRIKTFKGIDIKDLNLKEDETILLCMIMYFTGIDDMELFGERYQLSEEVKKVNGGLAERLAEYISENNLNELKDKNDFLCFFITDEKFKEVIRKFEDYHIVEKLANASSQNEIESIYEKAKKDLEEPLKEFKEYYEGELEVGYLEDPKDVLIAYIIFKMLEINSLFDVGYAFEDFTAIDLIGKKYTTIANSLSEILWEKGDFSEISLDEFLECLLQL